MHVDIDFNIKIEKRENFDTMIEREIISTQNNDFRDVAKFIKIANKINLNEISKIDFAKLINDMNINVDSLDNKNVTKNINFVIVIVTNFDIDVKKNVNIANSFDVNIAIFVFDVKKRINITISFDKNIAFSFANFSIF